MEKTITDAGKLRKQISIKISPDEIEAEEAILVRQYAPRMNSKGFRNGRVPVSVVKKRFGASISAEVKEKLINKAFSEAMKEENLQIFGQVEQGEMKEGDGIETSATFDVAPEITLPEMTGLKITKTTSKITEKEIKAEIDSARQRSGTNKPLKKTQVLKVDDQITLTGKITANGETIREVHDLKHLLGTYPLLGKEKEDVIAMTKGKKIGFTLEFDTVLPETYKPEEWAGKEASVSLTVQEADRAVPAELNEDFFKTVGVETEEEFKDKIKEQLQGRKDYELNGKNIEEATEELIKKTKFDIPEKSFDDTVKAFSEGEARKLETAKASEEDIEKAKKDGDGEYAKEAERMIRRNIILSKVIEEYKVEATDQDIQQQIFMAAYQSGRKPEEVAKQLKESGQINQVRNEILEAKALEAVIAKIKGEEKEDDTKK